MKFSSHKKQSTRNVFSHYSSIKTKRVVCIKRVRIDVNRKEKMHDILKLFTWNFGFLCHQIDVCHIYLRTGPRPGANIFRYDSLKKRSEFSVFRAKVFCFSLAHSFLFAWTVQELETWERKLSNDTKMAALR